ncbi:unnamed protein product [Arabidopsis lyrata]|nr:unnamed protein product [Arabidopsis lyrata]
MAVGINAMAVTFVAHALAVIAAIMVLVWSISYRGGLAWEATNKNLIFNLHPVLMLIGFIILGGEAIISYKSLPLEKPVKKLIHLILQPLLWLLGSLASVQPSRTTMKAESLISTVSILGLVLESFPFMASSGCTAS